MSRARAERESLTETVTAMRKLAEQDAAPGASARCSRRDYLAGAAQSRPSSASFARVG